MYIAFAETWQWTPDVVDRLDPDAVEEVLTRWRAQADHRVKETADRNPKRGRP